MNEALIVALGYDKSSLNKGLNEAVADAKKAGRQMSQDSLAEDARRAAARKARPNNARDIEGALHGERRVERGLAGLTGALANMESVSAVAVGSIEALHSVFKVPLALGIGVAAAAAGYEKLAEAAKVAKERHEENSKAMASPLSIQGSQKPEEIQKGIAELNVAGGETRKILESYTTTLADFWQTALTGQDSMVAKLLHDQENIEARKIELSAAFVSSLDKEAASRNVLLHQSERQGELLRIQAEQEQEIAKAKMDGAAGLLMPDAMHAKILAAKANGADAAEGVNDKFDRADRAKSLESDILDIKRKGLDVENQTAEARVKAAEIELTAARTTEAKADATLRLTAERDILDAVKRVTAERRNQMITSLYVAQMQAEASAKEMATLQFESAELERQSRIAKPDEQEGLDLAKAKNQDAQDTLLDTHSERMFALADKMASASAGSDQASQMRSMQARATIADSHAEALESNPRATVEQLTEARDLAAKLRENYADIVRENKDLLNTTQAENAIMYEQLHGHDQLAEKLKIELGFRDKIQKALRDGNIEQAHALQLQEQLAIKANEKANNLAGKGAKFMADPTQTPQEQNAARLKWLHDKQNRDKADRKEARDARNGHAVQDMPGATLREQLTPRIGKTHMPGPTHMESHSVTPDIRPGVTGSGKPFSKDDLGDVIGKLSDIANQISSVGRDV